MDILQQSLQAADILSGEDNDDLFGELGLSFSNTSTENVGLPNELEVLASQGDALYNNDNQPSLQPTFEDFENANDPTGLSNFDTSQFLNTSAPVNAATMSQSNYQQQTRINSLNSTQQQSYENASLVQHTAQSSTTASHRNHYHPSVLHAPTSTMPQKALQCNVPVLHTASVQPSEMVRIATTDAQSIAVATCNSVFLKAPTQSLASSVQMNPATQPINISQTSMVQTAPPGSMHLSTPLQIVQPSSTLAQHGQRQLVALVQKPMIIQASLPSNQVQLSPQVINGIAVQPRQQNHNVAVVKIAGTNRALNLNDPKVVKALTANLLQKQQVEIQTGQQPQQQVIKLGQNNPVFNVVPQSRLQQPAMLRGTQQIALQNGQTILLNNGQQMQICTTQSQAGQIQVLQPGASVQTVAAARRTHHQTATGGLVQATRNGQLPFKGIQIASVSIPIASSITNAAANISSVQGNVVTLPVVAQSVTTSSSIGTTTGNSVTVTQANAQQMPSSSTVRSLLANAILRQNNVSTNNGNTSSVSPLRMNSASNAIAVNGQVANTGQTQVPTMLRLNLTPQQVSQLTLVQLQSILKQHQLSVQARAAANSNTSATAKGATTMVAQESFEKTMQTPQSSVTAVLKTSASVTTNANSSKPSSGEQPAIQVYKVEPTLTEAQVDEVKKFLTNRTIGSKLNNLTREQQQLVLAFQAQLKTMSSPVQQYYLRNPQLFMQKVLQHIRAGKPYILQVKVDPQQKPKIVSTVTMQKSQHPTISLTQDPNRANNRVNFSSPATVAAELAKQITPSDALSAKPAQITMKPTVTLQVPRHVIKRPLPEPPTKVSLVLEQLDCHKKMVTVPDCTHPFKSVRDAIRRLVPFHTCNIPNVKEDHFLESERIFDQISDRIAVRTRTMVNKYHLLCLRDSTRDSCSAEMVMIERMFLQKEKLKLAEDKARLRDDPSLIKEYFPRHISNETKSVKTYDGDTSRDETNSENISISSAYDKDQLAESPISNDDTSALSMISESSSDFRTSSKGRYYSHDSSGGPSSAKRLKHTSSNNSESEDMLLQEAVGSILT